MSFALRWIIFWQVYWSTLAVVLTSVTDGILVPSIHQTLPQDVATRADYTYTPGVGSHKIHTTVATWANALKICRDEGAHLAVINSQAESDAIARVFAAGGPHPNSYSYNYVWIGTHDLISQRGDYETIFGESLAQAGFETWYEAKSTSSPYCGAAFRDGKLSWYTCSRKLGFVCELPSFQSYTADGECTEERARLILDLLPSRIATISSSFSD